MLCSGSTLNGAQINAGQHGIAPKQPRFNVAFKWGSAFLPEMSHFQFSRLKREGYNQSDEIYTASLLERHGNLAILLFAMFLSPTPR